MTAPQHKALGVGIIGSGFMGQSYARTVATLVKGAKLVGVTCGNRAKTLAEEYQVPCYDSLEALLACPEIDLVCIATPHACHGEQGLAAAQAGKHLLIDKPMAPSVAACDAILDCCKENQLQCSVTYTQRNRIGFRKAKETLETGRLGKVLEIRTYQIVADGMKAVPAWQLEPENIGLLFGHGIHNFDAIRALTGAEIKSVFAKCRSLRGAPVEGTTDALVTTEDGCTHYLFCSFEAPKPGFRRSECATRVICEKGLLDIDPYDESYVAYDGGDWELLAKQPPIDWAGQGFLDPTRLETYAGILQDLVDSIREERAPKVTGWDGRQAVAAVMAAYASSETGQEISLP